MRLRLVGGVGGSVGAVGVGGVGGGGRMVVVGVLLGLVVVVVGLHGEEVVGLREGVVVVEEGGLRGLGVLALLVVVGVLVRLRRVRLARVLLRRQVQLLA